MQVMQREAATILAGMMLFCSAIASNAHAADDDKSAPKLATYKGAYFEIKYPADFKARPLNAAKPAESSAAVFTSSDGAMEFYIFRRSGRVTRPASRWTPRRKPRSAERPKPAKAQVLPAPTPGPPSLPKTKATPAPIRIILPQTKAFTG